MDDKSVVVKFDRLEMLGDMPSKEERDKIDRFLQIVDRAINLYIEKNRRYGDSFTKQYEDFGNISACIRLTDKVERLKSLVKIPEDYGDEPIEDTLIDIVNYAIMTLMEIEKSKE